jgi:hypothetical protein
MAPAAQRRSFVIAIVAAFILLLLCYFGSAYFCFWRLTTALQEHDRDRLAFYVDFRGVRESLKKQWHERLAQEQPAGGSAQGSKADRIASMINAVAPNLIDQAIDAFVTPDGIMAVLEHPQAARDPAAIVAHRTDSGARLDVSSLRNAWFAGVRDFMVEHEGVKLHLRFSKWRWRLLDIDLRSARR